MENWEDIFNITPSKEAFELAGKYGYKPYMVERYLRMLPYNEVLLLLEYNDRPMPKTLRCNDYLIDCRELVRRLEAKGVKLEKLTYTRHGYKALEGGDKLGYLHEYLLGYYYIQGPASMIPVDALNPMPGELILDAAAAPGGKATQILQYTKDKAILVAVEKKRGRMKSLRSHLNRMGFTNHILWRGDSRNLPSGLAFDKILLDAPCSGEGIIRKDPRRKTSRSMEDLKKLSQLQIEMLLNLSKLLKPNGIMVYATCTIGVEENEYVISKTLRIDPSLEPIEAKAPGTPGLQYYSGTQFDERVSLCRRILPHQLDTEGFFICVLRKKA